MLSSQLCYFNEPVSRVVKLLKTFDSWIRTGLSMNMYLLLKIDWLLILQGTFKILLQVFYMDTPR